MFFLNRPATMPVNRRISGTEKPFFAAVSSKTVRRRVFNKVAIPSSTLRPPKRHNEIACLQHSRLAGTVDPRDTSPAPGNGRCRIESNCKLPKTFECLYFNVINGKPGDLSHRGIVHWIVGGESSCRKFTRSLLGCFLCPHSPISLPANCCRLGLRIS